MSITTVSQLALTVLNLALTSFITYLIFTTDNTSMVNILIATACFNLGIAGAHLILAAYSKRLPHMNWEFSFELDLDQIKTAIPSLVNTFSSDQSSMFMSVSVKPTPQPTWTSGS